MKKKVIFKLKADIVSGAQFGVLVGEFNDWKIEDGFPLEKQSDGSMKVAINLTPGKSYQYRYFLDGARWANDDNAKTSVDAFGSHVENCLIEVPAQKKNNSEKIVAKPKKAKTATNDDLTKILGVSRKIENVLQANQIQTYAALGKCTMKQILLMLEEESMKGKAKYYTSWAKQAKLAASDKCDELNNLKQVLTD